MHGGATVTGSAQIALAERSTRWTFGVLGVAALIGVSAAIAIQLAPGKLAHTAEAAPAQPHVQTTVAAVPVPVPAPVEAAPAAPVAVKAAVRSRCSRRILLPPRRQRRARPRPPTSRP